MLNLTWLIPALPFAGFLVLALAGGRMPRLAVAVIGAGSVGISAVLTMIIAAAFLANNAPGYAYDQTLWTWFAVGNFRPGITLHVDSLSLLMMFVVTFVGFLIHLYSVEFMAGEEGYSRFFAYMNLFVGMMLVLVLGGNLLILYLGWEGVGLCSYLLIGFWYRDPANGRAARKAFIVTRVGDTAFAIGLFILIQRFGTLDIQSIMQLAKAQWPVGSGAAVAVALLLLGGAVGKSAQLPLQTWLPDAMAGPTPVSALIHAATMVTAGVYLIARTHVLFMLAPAVQTLVAVIGALTLLLAGCSALTQTDIKRVLAYSTISQIGYMFLGLGVGAWTGAMFHFMTHAFFKALLFMAAGAVILAQHHEHDMFRMGGLRRELPVTFWCFLIGAASLSALPLMTAGFYSKDMILWGVWMQPGPARIWLWLAGVVTAFLTALYSFRMVFLTFFGARKTDVSHRPGAVMLIPIAILAVLSIVGGFVNLPRTLGNWPLLSNILGTVLPAGGEAHASHAIEAALQVITSLVAIAGVIVAWFVYLKRPGMLHAWITGPADALRQFWLRGWGFDTVYDWLFVKPFVWFARINRRDFIDRFYDAAAWFSEASHVSLSFTQTGQVRWYAMAIAIGAVLTLGIVVLL